MATLTSTELLNCLYIPDFIAPGSVMIFENAVAPVSWTKNTTHNDKALRLVSGTISSGGTLNFSSVLSSSVSLNAGQGQINQASVFTAAQNAASVTLQPGSAPAATINASIAEVVGHSHPYQSADAALSQRYGWLVPQAPAPALRIKTFGTTLDMNPTGSSTPHNHTTTITTTHTHTVTLVQHSHTATAPGANGPHTHPVTVPTQSFNVYYRDIIFATKD